MSEKPHSIHFLVKRYSALVGAAEKLSDARKVVIDARNELLGWSSKATTVADPTVDGKEADSRLADLAKSGAVVDHPVNDLGTLRAIEKQLALLSDQTFEEAGEVLDEVRARNGEAYDNAIAINLEQPASDETMDTLLRYLSWSELMRYANAVYGPQCMKLEFQIVHQDRRLVIDNIWGYDTKGDPLQPQVSEQERTAYYYDLNYEIVLSSGMRVWHRGSY